MLMGNGLKRGQWLAALLTVLGVLLVAVVGVLYGPIHVAAQESVSGPGKIYLPLVIKGSGTACSVGQFRAEYFPNRNLEGTPVLVRCEERIDYRWGLGAPASGLPTDNFSVRWTGRFAFNADSYAFIARTDDGVRIRLDGQLILDKWIGRPETEDRVTQVLTAGQHDVVVEYFDDVSDAVAQVRWEAACPVGQFRAEYFPNRNLEGAPSFARCEASVNQTWGLGGPGNGIGNDNFSVRWKGRFAFAQGTYNFIARTDDGMRIRLDGSAALLDEWRDQSAVFTRTATLAAGEHEVLVEYYDNIGDAQASVRWEPQCPTGQFRAEYYPNRSLAGTPTFVRCEATINQEWGTGGPGNGLPTDNFSVRWTGRATFEGARYAFIVRTDDGIRLWLDNNQFLNAWQDQGPTDYRVSLDVTAGVHDLKVEYYEGVGTATAQVRWERACAAGQFLAEYFPNRNLEGTPTFTRCEAGINQNWGSGGPGNGVPVNDFSVRWTGTVAFTNGIYRFTARTDDGMRIWIGANNILDEWRVQSFREYLKDVQFNASGDYTVRVEYFEATENALAQVFWARTSASDAVDVIVEP